MRALALLMSLTLSSCAALRMGWVEVTFIDGAEHADFMLCKRKTVDDHHAATCGPVLKEDERLLWEVEKARTGGNVL